MVVWQVSIVGVSLWYFGYSTTIDAIFLYFLNHGFYIYIYSTVCCAMMYPVNEVSTSPIHVLVFLPDGPRARNALGMAPGGNLKP